MSIESLSKVTLIGKLDHKAGVLEAIQVFGGLHLEDMKDKSAHSDAGLAHEKNQKASLRYNKAIAYLNAVPNKRKPLPLSASKDLLVLIDDIIANKNAKRQASDLRDDLLVKCKTLKPWGSFNVPSQEALGGQQLWFYLLPNKHQSLLSKIETPWKVLFKDQHKMWLVLVSPDEPHEDVLPVRHIDLGCESYQQVFDKLVDIEIQLEELESQRHAYTRYLNLLIRERNNIFDYSELMHALDLSMESDEIFIQKAWIATKHIDELKQLSVDTGFAVYIEQVDGRDTPPTLLNNPPSLEGGEMLVGFYQVPSYSSWDPSFILFSSFSIFFAMILSDAGYALVLAGLLALFWRKLSKQVIGAKFLPLLSVLVICSFVWGVLVGSYFGFPSGNHVLSQLHVFDINDFNKMMALSIGCGVVHIIVANAYQIVVGWGSYRAFQHTGWIITILGASGLGLASKYPELHGFSLAFLIFGLIVIFLSASNRKVKTFKDFIFKFLDGLKALTNVTSLFGDVLSYLRLFALGLASSSLALTFNQLADDAFHSDSGLSLLAGILILLVGHALNLALGIVSGVVHGLRLNYIEFYKWALYGEGYPFKAFKKVGVLK